MNSYSKVALYNAQVIKSGFFLSFESELLIISYCGTNHVIRPRYKVLKQVHPDTGISNKAMSIMNSVSGIYLAGVAMFWPVDQRDKMTLLRNTN